jgi:hypothetical protein
MISGFIMRIFNALILVLFFIGCDDTTEKGFNDESGFPRGSGKPQGNKEPEGNENPEQPVGNEPEKPLGKEPEKAGDIRKTEPPKEQVQTPKKNDTKKEALQSELANAKSELTMLKLDNPQGDVGTLQTRVASAQKLVDDLNKSSIDQRGVDNIRDALRSVFMSSGNDKADTKIVVDLYGRAAKEPSDKYKAIGESIGSKIKAGNDKLEQKKDLTPDQEQFLQRFLVLYIGRIKVINRDTLLDYAKKIKDASPNAYNGMKIDDMIKFSDDPKLLDTKEVAKEWLEHLKARLKKITDAENRKTMAERALK